MKDVQALYKTLLPNEMVTLFIRPFSFVRNFMRFWASYLIWHGTFLDLAARTNY